MRVPVIRDEMDLITAAMAYAESGLYPIPLNERGLPIEKRWQELRLRTPQDIAAHFAGASGIGIHPGASGLVAIDVDDVDAPPEWLWDELARAPFQSSRPGTERGHYLFEQNGHNIGLKTGSLPAGIDVRGHNGYIVVAPSRHRKGGKYEWSTYSMGLDIPKLPEVLWRVMQPASEQLDDVNQLILGTGLVLPDVIPTGQRHELLYRYACKLRAEGTPIMQAAQLMKSAWERCESTVGYSYHDALKEIDQAWGAFAPRAPGTDQPDSQHAEDDERDQNATYGLADLSWAIEGGELDDEEPPVVTRRVDGHALWYAGKLNSIYGEPESGKTWITLSAVADALIADQPATFIDVDNNGTRQIIRWLRNLGVGNEKFKLLRLYHPESVADLRGIRMELEELPQAVVVIDSVSGLLSLLGRNGNDNSEIRGAMNPWSYLASDTGACVIAIDHITKDASNTRFPIGAQDKKALVNGVMIHAVPKPKPTRGGRGILELRVEKDRAGYVREHSINDLFSRVVLDSDEQGAVTMTFNNPDADEFSLVSENDSDRQILECLAEKECTQADLVAVTGKHKNTISARVKQLLDGGAIRVNDRVRPARYRLAHGIQEELTD